MKDDPKVVAREAEVRDGVRFLDDEPDHGTGGGGGTKTAGYPVRQPPLAAGAAGANGTRQAG